MLISFEVIFITSITVGSFPLPFKLRKLKWRIENTTNEMRKFLKNSQISQKKNYASMRWFFRQFEKGVIRKSAMEVFSGHMAYVKSKIIILQYTTTSKKHFIRGRSRI